MTYKKCICFTSPVNGLSMKDAIAVQPNYNCPVHYAEENCEKHLWKVGTGFKNKGFLFCENCSKVKIVSIF